MQDYDKEHKPFEIKQVSGTEYNIHVDQAIINFKTKLDTRVVKYTNAYIQIIDASALERLSQGHFYVSIPVHMIMDCLNH